MSVKIGLIGGGYWGKNLIRDFHKLNVLHTICDINEHTLKDYREEYPQVNVTTKWSDILNNDEITAVCISLPAEKHYAFAKEAILKNKDVYVEKPLTLDVSEANELIKLANKKNKILMVGHLLHYHPCIEVIKKLVKDGEIGEIRNIISNRFNLGKFRVCENVLWSFAPHDISVILSLCNNELPDMIQCQGKDVLTNGVADITNTIMKYEKKNIYVNINVNWLNPYKEQKMSIIGTKGMIMFDDTKKEKKIEMYKDYFQLNGDAPPTPVKTKPIYPKYSNDAFPLEKECAHFIEKCTTRDKPITDGEEGLRVLEVLKACSESLSTNGSSVNIGHRNYYAHETAVIDPGAIIGENTKIWHFSHVMKSAEIGEKCNIGQNVYIAGKLGKGCKVQNNVSVYKGVECDNGVFLGPSCVFTNDKNPRCNYPKNGEYIKTYVEEGATIGANAVIVCGNRIGKYSLVGAGAVVTKEVKPYSVVVGNPAKKIGKIDKEGNVSIFEKNDKDIKVTLTTKQEQSEKSEKFEKIEKIEPKKEKDVVAPKIKLTKQPKHNAVIKESSIKTF